MPPGMDVPAGAAVTTLSGYPVAGRSPAVKKSAVSREVESAQTRVSAGSLNAPSRSAIFCGSGMTAKLFVLAAKMVAVKERIINPAILDFMFGFDFQVSDARQFIFPL